MIKFKQDKEKVLFDRMKQMGIREEDIYESFIRASAPGGQNVNKTSTCVYLKHLPTGIEVKCQRERSQVLNRYLAREILIGKIKEERFKKISAQRQQLEKIRRQKRKKPFPVKVRILENKRKHSQKKAFRVKVRDLDREG